MKKQLLIASCMLIVSLCANVFADTWNPQFVDNYIKMGAPAGGDRCGRLLIKPKSNVGQVLVKSVIYAGSTDTEREISNGGEADATANEAYVRLPEIGIRARFDWGGRAPSTHYRIYCFTRKRTTDFPQPANCAEVVDIGEVLNNRTCGGVAEWAGGTGAAYTYEKLNMNKG